MFDFALTDINTDHPSPLSVVYALLLSFILSTGIAFTYEKTSGHNSYPGHFIQAMILGSIIAAIVAQAIGDSIGRGLGMLGVLAMIRFRTNINQPRNMIFIFAALATGIACGVFAFNIALYGTILFCLVAFLLQWSPFRNYPRKNQLLRVTLDLNHRMVYKQIENQLHKMDITTHLNRIDVNTAIPHPSVEYIWDLNSREELNTQTVVMALAEIPEIKTLKMSTPMEEDSI